MTSDVRLPLEDIIILDLTQALAGPTASMVLGDLGARVIKIESPAGDLTRNTPPHYVDDTSLYFLSVNRNKEGMVLNLKDPRGLAVFYELVSKADVVLYNFRPGVVERLKIEHDTLATLNPRLVTCNITGFGRQGPEATRPAVDLIIQAMAGGMSITGEPGRPPVRAGVPTGDLSAGLYAVIGVLAGLQHRAATGEGIQVETSLFHAQLSLLSYVAAASLHSGEIPPPMGSGHIGTVPAQVFQTSNSYICIDAGFDHFFVKLCEAIGQPTLAEDARFNSRSGRSQHRAKLLPMLQEAFMTKTTQEWSAILDSVGIPNGPVNNVVEALGSAQVQQYNSIKQFEYSGVQVKGVGTPVWFNEVTEHPVRVPPTLGQHTGTILSELLKYEPEKIAELADTGAIYVGN